MRLLILGGTWFLGRVLSESALAAGWSVTTFNRGVSAPDTPGVTAVRGDRENADDLRRLAKLGPWDAVIDTIGYVPDQVLIAASSLAPAVDRYIYVSSVNVYTGWPDEALDDDSPTFECPPDAGAEFGANLGYAGQYGALKAGCERAVTAAVGEDRSVVLRPGVILGPHEYVGRLTWWLSRVARSGDVLVPGPAQRPIQPVDVRDVAAFAMRCAVADVHGSFNVTAPVGHATFADLIGACTRVTDTGARPVWVNPRWLAEQGVQQWTELPLWRIHDGVWAVDSSRAAAAGLVCRPLGETVRQTWDWMKGGGSGITGEGEASRAADHGLQPDREQDLLHAWRQGR